MLAACLLASSCVPVAAGEPTSGIVVKIYDGDTITVESTGVRHKCRLLGIDAPEISYGRLRSEMEKVVKYAPSEARQELEAARRTFEKWAAVMEARAREARDVLAAMVDGRTVWLAYDSKQPRGDRYGRLLVYVSAGDLNVNAEMVRRGLAVADTRFPCDRLGGYVGLWRAAQAAGVGLWARPEKPIREYPVPRLRRESEREKAQARTQELEGEDDGHHGDDRAKDKGAARGAAPDSGPTGGSSEDGRSPPAATGERRGSAPHEDADADR
jgi:endonuclease YncB( thermonuclease family)